jgi:hypothetical protein
VWTFLVVLVVLVCHDLWRRKRRRGIMGWSIRTDQRLAELEMRCGLTS